MNIMKHSILLLCAVVAIVVVVAIVLKLCWHRWSLCETFITGPCPNCGKRNKPQCFDCKSCGWCTTPDGDGECVPGNSQGPLFRQDCVAWQYEPMVPVMTQGIPYQRPTRRRRFGWWGNRGWWGPRWYRGW
jgi:hypothetical protein